MKLQVEESSRARILALEEEIRILRRNLDSSNFEIEKGRKEGEFNLKITMTELQAQLRRSQEETQRLQQMLNNEKLEFNKMKAFYDDKLTERNQELERLNLLKAELEKERQTLESVMKHNYEERIKSEQTKYTVDLNNITRRIESLTKQNEELTRTIGKYQLLES